MDKLVSIIVPVYKVEAYLEKCVDSIIAQTYTNLEIILVDDGSPDSCGEMCDAYAAKDPRIKVIHKKNGGLSDARNAALDIASGAYVCFVDSDDYVKPDYVEYLMRLMNKEKDIGISVCSMERPSGKSGSETDQEIVCDTAEAMSVLFYNHRRYGVFMCNKMYRRELFREVRFPYREYFEDSAVFPKLFGQTTRVAIGGGQKYYYYDVRPDSVIHVFNHKNYADKAQHLRDMGAFLEERYPQALPGYRKYAAYSYLGILLHLTRDYRNIPDYRSEAREFRAELKKVLGKVLLDRRTTIVEKGIMVFFSYVPVPAIHLALRLVGKAGKA